MPITVILSTEEVNRYGYRILSKGIQLDNYLKNPVLFYMHNTYSLPIGKVENIRIDDQSRLLGDLVFDPDDEEAQKIQKKFEKGYLNAVSVSAKPLSYSDAPEYLLPGQTRATVTQSELLEISVATVPGNASAIRLSSEGKDVIIPKIKSDMKLEKFALKLGLSPESDEATLLNKLQELQEQASESVQLKQRLTELETQLSDVRNKELDNLLNDPKKALDEESKKQFRELAAKDYETTLKLVQSLPNVQSLSDYANKNKGKKDAYENWTLKDFQLKAPEELARIKAEEPERFAELVKPLKK